jgi:hemerythrin
VSGLKSVVGIVTTKGFDFAFEVNRFSGKAVSELRHELVNAQVEVLRMYLEKQSGERLVEALDKLIECSEASFRNEEALMECLTGHTDPMHCEAHQLVLTQLVSLRACAMDSDRGRLLAHLILVDRELTSHIWEGLEAPDRQPSQDLAEREPSLHS